MVEFAALLAFVVALGVWLMWCRRTVSAALIYTILGITVAAGLVEMQARPKPTSMEWRSIQEAEVLWYGLQEDAAITLLLDLGEPRLYVLPWNQEQAEQLLRAGREAGETGGTLTMSHPFEPSLAEDERLFYAAPQPAPPLKG